MLQAAVHRPPYQQMHPRMTVLTSAVVKQGNPWASDDGEAIRNLEMAPEDSVRVSLGYGLPMQYC